MSEAGREIAYCHSCGEAMEVTDLAPFSNAGCPKCGKHTRVKREFGPYTLVRTHAIGGMSVVFAAQDNTLNREVALKILNEDYSADEKRIASFEEEARLTASISHPHVVRLLTTGRAFNRYYIAMEFVTGGHLERKIRDQGSLPEKDMLALALQVADGLRAAHRAGLIHRDVKPGNILLDGEGNAKKIVDFGLALVTHGGRATADEIWATPYYVPPEAIEGRSEDFRSDLYAFGATLYHALAGKPPCREESMATAKLREAKKRVVPLDQTAPWLGIETCALVDRAMAYDPGGRFRSYAELIDALQSALRNAKSGAGRKPPPTTATQIRQLRRSRSRRTLERLGMLVGILAVLGAIGFGVWWVLRPDEGSGGGSSNNGGRVAENGGKVGPGKGRNGGGDLAAQNRVGRKYTSARSSLEQRDYPAAEATFAEILKDKGAPEPTATLAGVESAIAALLDGRSGDARARAAAVQEHVGGLRAGVDPACKVLGAAAARVANLQPEEPGDSPPDTPAEVAAALLLALKNWEQGCHQQAVGWFGQVANAELGGSEWVSGYRQLATRYLADHEVLLETDYQQLPDTIEGCEALKLKLDAGLRKLQTNGRALFNLRQRRLQIARQARHLAKLAAESRPDPDQPPTLAEALPAIESLIGKSRFADAAERLKTVETTADEEPAQRNAWLYLAGASATFLADLASDLEQGLNGVQLSTADGSANYSRIDGIGETGPRLAAGENGAVEVPWGDLQPAQLIAVHQVVVRGENNPLEQARRHEQAIAYQFLVGDRERAKTAAGRLAETSPTFRQRWMAAMRALGM